MTRTKRIALFGTALLASALLTACSSGSSQQSANQGKPVGFVQLANEDKERIWFTVSDSNDDGEISKDDSIEKIHIIKKGTMNTYHIWDIKLKDIKDGSSKDIKKLASESDKLYFDKKFEERIKHQTDSVSQAQTELELWQRPVNMEAMRESPQDFWETFDLHEVSNADELIEKLTKDVEVRKETLATQQNLKYSDFSKLYLNKKVKAIVETDSSGNNVAEERIYFYGHNLSNSTEIHESKKELEHFIFGEIYDQYYTGYKLGDDEFLITSSLDKNIILGFDTLDTKNVTEE